MSPFIEENLHSLLTIHDQNLYFSKVTQLAQAIGFEFCAYGARMPFPLSAPRTEMVNNYPAAWQNCYAEHQYIMQDPTVAHGARSMVPLVWSDELFADSRDLWEDARSYGLRNGWAQGCRDGNGVVGMLTVARSGEPITAIELGENEPLLAYLTQVTHVGMSRFFLEHSSYGHEVKLTPRETEILRWTAEGKTSAEIGDILNIAERTVNFHVNSTLAKLNAANKTSAVVQAALRGLL
ncbi:autoinducer binding domain-containing protein [Silvimonas amylolytica]|uniref:LuxR family transcriptional regulator n=1 Tax=Silvimonas amylolytica TaxID=449663 RepID=A0ABQ2PPZ6_9NEIS|nr:autoinducer binding domain-containing protein [Silvimonas amylolytica]GGP27383.1 LuxR family transcriptional regulator [Silvimonas amylolytica]